MPAEKLHGMGGNNGALLRKLHNIVNITDLQRLSVQQLSSVIGPAKASQVFKYGIYCLQTEITATAEVLTQTQCKKKALHYH